VDEKARHQSGHYIIDLSKSWHVAWWAEHFGVSEPVLNDAVALVGPKAELVELYLNGRKASKDRVRSAEMKSAQSLSQPR
jgi:hypothetical protein